MPLSIAKVHKQIFSAELVSGVKPLEFKTFYLLLLYRIDFIFVFKPPKKPFISLLGRERVFSVVLFKKECQRIET